MSEKVEVTLSLPDWEYDAVVRTAKRWGMTPELYLETLIADRFGRTNSGQGSKGADNV